MRFTRALAVVCVAVLMAAVFAGCGSSDSSSSSGSDGKTPAPLKSGGDFLFCTDVPYAPAEYQEGSKFVGYEIDIATEVGKRLGVKATFQKTGFDGIIAALQAKKCDAIISSMNSTAERKKQVDFVDYMSVGQSLLMAADDAADVTSLAELGGKTVGVQVGTTLKDAIDSTNKTLSGDKIEVQSFPDAGAAAAAVQTGKVDAFFTDSPVAADYVNKHPKDFAFGGEPIDPLPVGIAIRKSDKDLSAAVQKAVDEMYSDGTMKTLLDTWKAGDFALEGK